MPTRFEPSLFRRCTRGSRRTRPPTRAQCQSTPRRHTCSTTASMAPVDP